MGILFPVRASTPMLLEFFAKPRARNGGPLFLVFLGVLFCMSCGANDGKYKHHSISGILVGGGIITVMHSQYVLNLIQSCFRGDKYDPTLYSESVAARLGASARRVVCIV
jgi:hypothetical protein